MEHKNEITDRLIIERDNAMRDIGHACVVRKAKQEYCHGAILKWDLSNIRWQKIDAFLGFLDFKFRAKLKEKNFIKSWIRSNCRVRIESS